MRCPPVSSRDRDFAGGDTGGGGDVEREHVDAERSEGEELGDGASCGNCPKTLGVEEEAEVMAEFAWVPACDKDGSV